MYAIVQNGNRPDGHSGLCFDIFINEYRVSFVNMKTPQDAHTMRHDFNVYKHLYTFKYIYE